MIPPFVRPNIRTMAGYTPGEQPGLAERVVKLNTNENPYPPSPKVMHALAHIEPDMLRKYPNPTADAFRDAAARVLGVTRDNIIAGNGSDDILSIAVRTFLGPADLLAFPDPTYSLYPVLADMNEVESIGVPWADGLQLPIDALLATTAKGIFLANPNAPTGHLIPIATIRQLAERFIGLVLVDEAYCDFAGETSVGLVKHHPNIVVSRTFSKGYSMAGVRFGYAVAQPEVIEQMMKVKDSYNCDAVAIAVATAAILDQDYARQTWEKVRSERDRMTTELTKLGWSVIPSRANFLLAGVPGGDGKAAYLKLKERGVLVRFFDKPGLRDKVRITIGTPEENETLLAAIRQ